LCSILGVETYGGRGSRVSIIVESSEPFNDAGLDTVKIRAARIKLYRTKELRMKVRASTLIENCQQEVVRGISCAHMKVPW